ncbi:MAG: alpha/beta family hydrolase [Myxococcota bacterium]|nr:alpha/beta family hydrolase [Myxococcota bacterium]
MTPLALLFAHGAGAGSMHPWMQAWAQRLGALGSVTLLDYPYIRAGRRAPDRLPRLLASHREALGALRARHPGPVVLVGKSMGARVGCHVSLDDRVDAVVCLGYPLVGGGKKRAVRDAVLKKMTTPVLFVQGSRDPMGPLSRFGEVRNEMAARSAIHVVDGGNHSLVVGKRALAAAGEDQAAVDARTLAAIGEFLRGIQVLR